MNLQVDAGEAAALSGLAFAMTDVLKSYFPKLKGRAVEMLAFFIAAGLTIGQTALGDDPLPVGRELVRVIVQAFVTAFAAIFFAKARGYGKDKQGDAPPA